MSGSFPQEKTLDELRPLRLRFVAAREVANLHGFPPEFAFPATVGQKKQMELLGNSLSVQVLETLLRYLLACDKPGDGPQQRESAHRIGLESVIRCCGCAGYRPVRGRALG